MFWLAGLVRRRADPPFAGEHVEAEPDPERSPGTNRSGGARLQVAIHGGAHYADAVSESLHWPSAYRVPSLSSNSAHQPKC
jgi:hypothetical protein